MSTATHRRHPVDVDTTKPHHICIPKRSASGNLTGEWCVVDLDGVEVFVGDEHAAFKHRDVLNRGLVNDPGVPAIK